VPELLASRGIGETVVDHRSSWVRRIAKPGEDVFIKTYEYSSWSDRLGNWGKWTAPMRKSRAARECMALNWLREHDFATAEPLACLEWRKCGFLARATLVSANFGGGAADRILPKASPADRRAIAHAIGELVARLHAAGFRDRNLDLRNLLVRNDDGQLTIAKIDSPRFRIIASGRRAELLAEADWQRLLPQLEAFDVADVAVAARRKAR